MKHKKHILCLCTFVVMGLIGVAAGAGEFVIARDGAARAGIVALPGAGAMAEAAVRDFRRVVGVMSGGTPELWGDVTRKPVVVIGLADEWAKLTKDEGPATRLKGAVAESFVLSSTPDRLLILGKDPNGVSHGVYTLLRDLGCRWYFIAPEWEVIPRSKTVAVTVDRVEGPALRMRRLNCGMAQGGLARELFEDWQRRNRMGSAYGKAGISHAYANYVPGSLFKEHPEYFAWVSADGDKPGDKQNGLQPCTTRPEVVKLFQEGALSILRKRKERDPSNTLMLSVSPNDNTGNMCRCEKCRAVGSYTDCALLIANQVAEAIHGEFPDTLVGFMAYGRVAPPPTPGKKAHPNVIVSLATAYTWRTSTVQMLKEWPQFVRHLIIREYYCISQWGGANPDYRGIKLDDISRTLAQWNRQGIEGVEAEMNHSWGSCGHRFWAAAELMWDPKLSAEQVRKDFYSHCWGGAAAPMRRYYERWEGGQIATPRVMGLAFRDLSEAARLEKTPEIAKRVDLLTLYLHWYHLKLITDEITEKGKQLKLNEADILNQMADYCEEGNKLLYRWKEAYLLSIQPRAYKMTRDAPPFTPAEVEAIRQADIAYYRAKALNLLEMGGVPFSTDFVPIKDYVDVKSLETCDSVQGRLGNVSYLTRMREGEEIRIVFERGVSRVTAPAGDRKKFDKARVAAKVPDDEEEDPRLEAEAAPTDAGARVGRVEVWSLGNDGRGRQFVDFHPITMEGDSSSMNIKVPKAGLYLVNVKIPRGKSLKTVITGCPYSIMADVRNRSDVAPLAHLPKLERNEAKLGSLYYFYVPAGTTCFEFQCSRLKSAKPLDWQIDTVSGSAIEARKATRESSWIVQVPADKAGAIWRLRLNTDSFLKLGFDGIPPVVATLPANLLVPREAVCQRSSK